jgi:hypothetical protein
MYRLISRLYIKRPSSLGPYAMVYPPDLTSTDANKCHSPARRDLVDPAPSAMVLVYTRTNAKKTTDPGCAHAPPSFASFGRGSRTIYDTRRYTERRVPKIWTTVTRRLWRAMLKVLHGQVELFALEDSVVALALLLDLAKCRNTYLV